ncbi:hypothetical protein EX30DRAFT_398030 [Ascodesmis nigricans]|uniref:Uncharacterized protein n=1 Tax=Ascodesmis nigricans TaxID=341454 RepID=A0A4S2MME6_9PEZI|nr:hypothetical protein EX30DRAFT_398030 [Ascodesmis nigricans]
MEQDLNAAPVPGFSYTELLESTSFPTIELQDIAPELRYSDPDLDPISYPLPLPPPAANPFDPNPHQLLQTGFPPHVIQPPAPADFTIPANVGGDFNTYLENLKYAHRVEASEDERREQLLREARIRVGVREMCLRAVARNRHGVDVTSLEGEYETLERNLNFQGQNHGFQQDGQQQQQPEQGVQSTSNMTVMSAIISSSASPSPPAPPPNTPNTLRSPRPQYSPRFSRPPSPETPEVRVTCPTPPPDEPLYMKRIPRCQTIVRAYTPSIPRGPRYPHGRPRSPQPPRSPGSPRSPHHQQQQYNNRSPYYNNNRPPYHTNLNRTPPHHNPRPQIPRSPTLIGNRNFPPTPSTTPQPQLQQQQQQQFPPSPRTRRTLQAQLTDIHNLLPYIEKDLRIVQEACGGGAGDDNGAGHDAVYGNGNGVQEEDGVKRMLCLDVERFEERRRECVGRGRWVEGVLRGGEQEGGN